MTFSTRPLSALRAFGLVTCVAVWTGAAWARHRIPRRHPARTDKPAVTAQKFMVVAANKRLQGRLRHAQARRQRHRRGDRHAAGAGLVEPQSSGIGGGAFSVYWDNERRTLASYDGRETAPAQAGPDLFTGADGKPMKFWDAVVGGRSWARRPAAHAGAGAQAARQADLGGTVRTGDRAGRAGISRSPRLTHSLVGRQVPETLPEAAAYFYDGNGKPWWKVGHIIRNPAYAEVLRAVAQGGADAFYRGPSRARSSRPCAVRRDNPGLLNLTDLGGYEAKPGRPPAAPIADTRSAAWARRRRAA